jgi:hypothetical protein
VLTGIVLSANIIVPPKRGPAKRPRKQSQPTYPELVTHHLISSSYPKIKYCKQTPNWSLLALIWIGWLEVSERVSEKERLVRYRVPTLLFHWSEVLPNDLRKQSQLTSTRASYLSTYLFSISKIKYCKQTPTGAYWRPIGEDGWR